MGEFKPFNRTSSNPLTAKDEKKAAKDAKKSRVDGIRTFAIAFNQFSLDNARFH